MKIRVLHVIDHLGYGGAPFVVKNLVERMPADRIESIVCALRPNPKSLPIAAEVITLACRKYSPAAIRALVDLSRRQQIDIIHAHLQKAALSSLLAQPRCASRLVLHEHGPIFRGGTGCIYRGCLRFLGPRADAFIANSAAAQAALQHVLHGASVPITVVPNFIDLARFDPDRYDREQVRSSLGLDPATFVVGFVGRLDRAKGVDLLLEAWRRDADLNAHPLHLCGAGEREKEFREFVARHDLNVIFEGRLTVSSLQHVIAHSRALVNPSRLEGFSIALLEALACGTPVIGWAEQVRELEQWWGLPVGLPFDGRTQTADQLAEAVRNLLEGPTQRDASRAGLAANSRRHFTLERYGEENLTLYAQMTGARTAG